MFSVEGFLFLSVSLCPPFRPFSQALGHREGNAIPTMNIADRRGVGGRRVEERAMNVIRKR